MGIIKEEGDIRGIGPFIIEQEISTKNSEFYFKYILYYYLTKVGTWNMYDENSKMNYVVDNKIPESFTIDELANENSAAIKKRRNKYLRRYKLDKNYYE